MRRKKHTFVTKISFLFLLIISIIMPTSLFAENAGMVSLGAEVGNLAPDFSFQDASGKWVSLSDFRGKKVFIFSWSSWCRCKYQLPELEKFYRKHKSDKFEIITVASDSQGFKWAQKYLDVADATFLTLIDPANELGRTYDFWATENGFFIDESGIIRMRQIGFYIDKPEHLNEVVKLINTDFNVGDQTATQVSLEERIKNKEAALASNPKDFQAMLKLGELYRQGGDLVNSEKVFRNAVKRKHFSAEAHYRLGVVIYQRGEVKKALREWKKAFILEPTNYLYMRNVESYYRPDKFYSDLEDEMKEREH